MSPLSKKVLLLVFLFFSSMFLCAQSLVFSDTAFFKSLVKHGVDANRDGVIELKEAHAVTSLKVEGKEIKDLAGIEHFQNLESLRCYHTKLTTLNLTSNKKLKSLYCSSNPITSLSVQGLDNLENLECTGENWRRWM